MLGKSLSKKLSEQNWEKAMERDSNPTQTWIRTRTKADRALKHLIILANTLPDDKQEKIFSIENMNELIDTILRQPVWAEPHYDKLDPRRSKLAAVLAEKSLKKCIAQYDKLEEGKAISKRITTHLEESIDICEDIALKTELKRKESKESSP
jgi:hypothetical protein